MPQIPAGTVTLLFTDIEGSTRLWEEYQKEMHVALARHDAILRTVIEAHGGHVFKTIGDAFCAAFHTAPQAIEAAALIQADLASEAWSLPNGIRVRMAIHTGAVESRDGDYFGPPLNRVARLLGVGHGGQVLVSSITHELARDSVSSTCSFANLGEHRLRDLRRPEMIFQLLSGDETVQFPPLKSLDNPDLPNNLPLQMTSFVGREREMADVQELLQQAKLGTLTGSGGTGKTRLAIEVASELLDKFKHGVWLVELAAITDPSLVAHATAQAIGVREQAGQTIAESLLEFLKSRQTLIVMDNCEHLLDAVAQLVYDALRQCPDLRILATSREPLGVQGEKTYRVAPLSMPDESESSPTKLAEFESARLLIERAYLVNPDFAVTIQNAPALAQVCRNLDGIPLAIELAAARCSSMTIQDINSRLGNRFRLLTGGNRGALPRQQTLRALIDWSYDLLEEAERKFIVRLSVFVGGWTPEAAYRVASDQAGPEALDDWEVADLLADLAAKSLIMGEESESGTRFRMLETMRQYTREKLTEAEEFEAVQRRHRAYYLELAEKSNREVIGASQKEVLKVMDAEHGNFRAAIDSCYSEPQDVLSALKITGALWRFWFIRGFLSEGVERSYRAVSASPDLAIDPHELKVALASSQLGAGVLARYSGDFEFASEHMSKAVVLFRELDDRMGLTRALGNLASLHAMRGEHEKSAELYAESLALARESGSKHNLSVSLMNYGTVAFMMMDFDLAESLFIESLGLARELDDRIQLAFCLVNLGAVHNERGRHEEARGLLEEALSIRRILDDRWGSSHVLHALGHTAFLSGDPIRSMSLEKQALAIQQEFHDYAESVRTIQDLALACAQTGAFRQAAVLFGALQTQREALKVSIWRSDQEKYDRCLPKIRESLGDEGYEAAYADGQVLTWDQAMTYALGV